MKQPTAAGGPVFDDGSRHAVAGEGRRSILDDCETTGSGPAFGSDAGET